MTSMCVCQCSATATGVGQLYLQSSYNKVHNHATMKVVLPNTVLLMSSVLLWMQKPSSLNVVLHAQQLYAGNELWLSKRKNQLYFCPGGQVPAWYCKEILDSHGHIAKRCLLHASDLQLRIEKLQYFCPCSTCHIKAGL